MNTLPRPTRLGLEWLLLLAAAPAAAQPAAPVLPTAPQVVRGQARFDTSGQAMTVTTSRGAAIDWRSFSIGPRAAVRFDQPDSASQVLNRVLGRDPSQILGRLSSNGEVWLLNPYGVLFGRDARVDVKGLVASSLNIGADDWAAGRRVLAAVPGQAAAAVVNAGTLSTSAGGRVLLVGAGEVSNDGTIDAPGGRIGLRGTSRIDLADSRQPDIAVRLATVDGAVANRGTITAAGGVIDLQAAMVNQAGVVRADALTQGPGGTVLLQAADTLALGADSATSARGDNGGRIDLVGGTQNVQGRIDAGSATGSGGRIALAGPRIALLGSAVLQADGARGGGQVRIGTALDLPGRAEPAAQAVFMGNGARVSANATERGNGGRIDLLSGGVARVFGGLSARGGRLGGDGGAIETSAPGLRAEPTLVDTSAPRGRAGLWLLDPRDIVIVNDTVVGTNIDSLPDFSPVVDGQVTTGAIEAALVNGNVTISTNVPGTQAGNISMVDATLIAQLPTTTPSERTLTLQANAGIRLEDATITTSSGRLNLRLLAGESAQDNISLTRSSIDVPGNLTMRSGGFSVDTSTVSAATIDLQASRVRLGDLFFDSDSRYLPALSATGPGTSLLIRGLRDNVDSFGNEARIDSALALSAANGRWLLYARDPAATTLAGLDVGFTQYGVAYPTASALGSGNGLLYGARVTPGSNEDPPQRPFPPTWTTLPPVQPACADIAVASPPTAAGLPAIDFGGQSASASAAQACAQDVALGRAFGRSIATLNNNPAVARLPDCSNVGGALAGSCVITPQIKAELTALWLQQPSWAGTLESLQRDELFELMFWDKAVVLTPVLAGLPQPVQFIGGDGSTTTTSLSKVLSPELGPAGQPPAAGASPSAGASPTAAPRSTPPVCETAQQRLSGECQRQAELDSVDNVLQRCSAQSREQQPECLFARKVKEQLQQREREGQLLSRVLQTRESRRPVLPDIRRKWALVIGVDEYPKVKPQGQPVRMPSAGHSARALASELSSGFGYITSELINPSRAQVVQRLNMLAAIAQPHDSLLVFFSGYGFDIQGEDAVWALADADPQDGGTVLLHADVARLLTLIDARQVALISDSAFAKSLRVKPVEYNALVAPDAASLLDRRATVALTSGANAPLGSVAAQGRSYFADELLGVLRRVKSWHIGSVVFGTVSAQLSRAGRVHVPQYGAASSSMHEQRADYVLERRELDSQGAVKP